MKKFTSIIRLLPLCFLLSFGFSSPLNACDNCLCFSHDITFGAEECEFEICLDIQTNTGDNCEDEYSVTRVCETIAYGETACFNLDQADVPPFDPNYCSFIIGGYFSLSGNIAYFEGEPWNTHDSEIYFNQNGGPCNNYTHLLFQLQSDGTFTLFPTYILGEMEVNDQLNKPNKSQAVLYQQNISEASTSANYTLFPNPTSEQLNIHFDTEQSYIEVTLLDVNGKTIQHTYALGTNQLLLDIPAVTTGLFFLKIQTEEKSYLEKVFIRQ